MNILKTIFFAAVIVITMPHLRFIKVPPSEIHNWCDHGAPACYNDNTDAFIYTGAFSYYDYAILEVMGHELCHALDKHGGKCVKDGKTDHHYAPGLIRHGPDSTLRPIWRIK